MKIESLLTKRLFLLAATATMLLIAGCGNTYVRNLKPPPLIKTSANVMPCSVGVVVSKDLIEYKTVLKYLEGDQTYIFRSLPDYLMQTLIAHFEKVDVVPDGEPIPKDKFDLIARMSITTEERKLNWAVAGFFMTITLKIEDRHGRNLLTKSLDVENGVFGEAPYGEAEIRASQAVAKTFSLFGEAIERSAVCRLALESSFP